MVQGNQEKETAQSHFRNILRKVTVEHKYLVDYWFTLRRGRRVTPAHLASHGPASLAQIVIQQDRIGDLPH
jgi:hypothetical protein